MRRYSELESSERIRLGLSGSLDEHTRDAVAAHFDPAFYLATNPDIRELGVDPLDHFLLLGWKESRDPARSFNVTYYLQSNGDVAAAGINPFVHYIVAGHREGRAPRRKLDNLRAELARSTPPSLQAVHWSGAADVSEPHPAANLRAALEKTDGSPHLVVSASHDDYMIYSGGVQNMIGDERRAFERAGWGYLHLSPAAPLPLLAQPEDAAGFRAVVRLAETRLGVFTVAGIASVLHGIRAAGTQVDLVVHHAMGWAPEVLDLLADCASTAPVVWIHDFFTICPRYNLMRNDVAFCHGPPPQSSACRICSAGHDRDPHVDRMTRFMAQRRPTVLAPSQVALDFWLDRSGYEHSGTAVIPLARLAMTPGEAWTPPAGRPLRVGFIGARVAFKGWAVFEGLALQFANDPRYRFYHFGIDAGPAMPGCITNVPVRVTQESREAMIEALAERSIDVVISWSLWLETYCFALHEALSAGAFIIARADAGNTWLAVQRHAPLQGCAVETEADLAELFATEGLMKKLQGSLRSRGALIPARGTADWLLRDQHESGPRLVANG